MQIKKINNSPTNHTLLVVSDSDMIKKHYNRSVALLSKNLNLSGFRKGSVPPAIAVRNIDSQSLQSEFLDSIINEIYIEAVKETKITPANRPTVSIKKFVPYETLELSFDVDVIGEIKLPSLTSLKTKKQLAEVKTSEINSIIEDLRTKEAIKKPVTRAAKLKDEVIFDFDGIDSKTKEPIEGAKADDYPLILGSNNFIPGFEEELVGLKKNDTKEFDITFPKDYQQSDLRSKKVTFKVNIKEVNQLELAVLDEEFVKKVGPFETVDQLKKAIKDQLLNEKQQNLKQLFDNQIVEELVEKTSIELPDSIIEVELDRLIEQDKMNVLKRNQTFQEHLEEEGVTEEEHRQKNKKLAEQQIKAGLILSRLSSQLNIVVTDQELSAQLDVLRGYYASDEAMVKELSKKENHEDIRNRMIIEKTLTYLENQETKPVK